MFSRKHKSGSELGIVKPEKRLIGLLRREMGFKTSFHEIGKNCQIIYGESKKEIESALLEAEYNKAKANLTAQQARSFC
jgi:hypothetical protein